ncbi:MAG: hypothetical protein AAFV77_09985 [Planctomycetota bacterium]
MAALLVAGCVREVRVFPADPAQTLRDRQQTRLTSPALSEFSRDALTQLDLVRLHRRDAIEAADALSRLADEQPDAPWRLAAAEILLDIAEDQGTDPSLFLACAMQADLELQRAIRDEGGLLDSRTQFAANLYRRSVARFVSLSSQQWLRDGSSEVVEGAGGRFVASIAPDIGLARFGPGAFDTLKPADFVRVRGMRNHHRLNAYGAPMVAIREQSRARPPRSEPFVPPEGLMTAATVTLRFDWFDRVAVEVWNPDHARTVEQHDATLRLSTDVTAPIAQLFSRTSLITSGRRGLLNIQDYLGRLGIYMHEPYDPSKIPVLMVHGLRSSPATWRDMLNGLRHDPDIRERYQFWMFYYPTGLPIARSAAYLRAELSRIREHFDPDGTNTPMDQMVLLGHSMGGLLSKAQVQDSGDRLWHSLHPEPFDEVAMPVEVRAHLQEVFFYNANPGIARLVFIATPHRGSGFASNWISRLGDLLVDLPDEFDSIDPWFLAERERVQPGPEYQLERGIPSSIDDLREDSPHLIAYLETPMREGVPFHLVAGDTGDGTDGIVSVESATIDGAKSRLIVESGHEAHTHPLAIREIRRILLLHLEETSHDDTGS